MVKIWRSTNIIPFVRELFINKIRFKVTLDYETKLSWNVQGTVPKRNKKSRHDNNIKLAEDCNAQLRRDEYHFF